jgi:hypothetical protein
VIDLPAPVRPAGRHRRRTRRDLDLAAD